MLGERFKVVSPFEPRGDQPKAISQLVDLFKSGRRYLTLLGVTGSGKTFVVSKVVEALNLPTLVISPNKVLAAQLFSEFREFFPENAVEFFISYYDFYQPEAYLPDRDIYIEKEAVINKLIDRLRHRATTAIMTRRDTLIVASVSCIYNIGSPEIYGQSFINLRVGDQVSPEELLDKLVVIGYEPGDWDFTRGTYRYRGESILVFPQGRDEIIRVDFDDDVIDRLILLSVEGEVLAKLDEYLIPPARHFLTQPHTLEDAIRSIREELKARLEELKAEGKIVEARRLKVRTEKDIELLLTHGYCPGIENYWRHLSGLPPGTPPFTLLDYFRRAYGEDFLVVVDESHITIPQLKAMYRGDKSRKETLVEHGFRLPSCLDNRPLSFQEFLDRVPKLLMVSATPGDWELEHSEKVVELIVRPTGIVDPVIEVRPREGALMDILNLIQEEKKRGNRVLVVTLTQDSSEELANFLASKGIKSAYLHARVEPLDRVEILKGLRSGTYDVLVGVNLLREGLDLPEVSVVAILDADRQGFLRSKRSLIQIAGRAARHLAGKVILYADEVTEAMREAIEETERRRKIQLRYNEEHNITPKPVKSKLKDPLELVGLKRKDREADSFMEMLKRLNISALKDMSDEELKILIDDLVDQMKRYATEMEFEKAAAVRDKLMEIKRELKVDIKLKSLR